MPLYNDQAQARTQKLTEDQLFTVLEKQRTHEFRNAPAQQPQQPGQVAARPVQQLKSYSSLSKDEKKAEKEKHKAIIAQNTFCTAKDMETIYGQHVLQETVKIEGEKITQAELFEKVMNGDVAHMEKLDGILRNRVATEYFRTHRITGTPKEFVAELKRRPNPVTEMLNPRMRLAISLVMNSPEVTEEVKAKYREIDELLNTEIMKATLVKKTTTADGFSQDEIQRSVASQVFITKMLLSAHLGKFIKRDSSKNPPDTDWPGNVANAFTHCSRVVYTLPGQGGEFDEKKENKMLGNFYGGAGFFTRWSATHALHRKRREGADAEEAKVKVNPINQYRMNVAIGGLGNNGIPDSQGHARKLKNDGSCGHLYMHLEKGDKEKHSGMLFGFESDSFMTMNQLGHTHDIIATGEFASSFGGQRCDEIGDKYGGRIADLSEVNIDAYTEVMSLCDQAMNALLSGQYQDQGELNEIAESVTGKLMEKDDLLVVFTHLINVSNVVNGKTSDPYKDAEALYGRLGIHK